MAKIGDFLQSIEECGEISQKMGRMKERIRDNRNLAYVIAWEKVVTLQK